MGPLDRIVQAAGRCNREGKLSEGRVVIFEVTGGGSPRGPYKAGIEETRALLGQHKPECLHKPQLYQQYFRRLFSVADLDGKRIQPLRRALDYPKVAREYRLIEDSVPVVVPYGDAERYLNAWRSAPGRQTWQRLQPYLVNLHTYEARQFEKDLQLVSPGLYEWLGTYNNTRGLAAAKYDHADFVV